MAISDDTAALVAAQLTVAWATIRGPQSPNPAKTHDEQVSNAYVRFRDIAAESGAPYDYKPDSF